MFIKNFNNDEYEKNYSLRKNTTVSENDVVRVIFKKLSRKIKELDVYNAIEKIEELKQLTIK